jgi:hypothetical protein
VPPIFATITLEDMANVSFDNTEIAFAYKTNKALKKARFLYIAL